MADDPGSDAASRPARRRRYDLEFGLASRADGQTDGPPAIEPAPDGPHGDRPFPTFLHVAPGNEPLRDTNRDGDRLVESTTPGAPPTPGVVDHGWLPMLDDRSPDPDICPFLRAVDDTDRLVAAIEVPDPANRCAALREAVPQSLRQQELVCLAAGHVNCPRYLRGAVVVAEAPPEPVVRAGRSLSPAVLGSLVVLVMSASASLAFVMARGGLELTAAVQTSSAAPSAPALAVASVTPAPSLEAAPTPVPTALSSPRPTASPLPTPSATPQPTAEPTSRPAATSDRYAVLRPCPDAPRCWIYQVRSGDNLYSIAHWFGVSLDSIYSRNPWTRTTGLRVGQELRLPPPTR